MLAACGGAPLVSAELPLRANLSVLENVTLVAQIRLDAGFDALARSSLELLERVGCAAAAHKRDDDLSAEERFGAKLARALVLGPAVCVIDRPALLLPDTHYPPHVARILAALADRYEECRILDYAWNAPLYPPPLPQA